MAYKEFTDTAGVSWRAWDTRPRSDASVRPHYARGWLSFESDTSGRKRLAPIPHGWEEATVDELCEFLEQAQPIASAPAAPGTPEVDAAVVEASRVEDAQQESVLDRIRSMLRGMG